MALPLTYAQIREKQKDMGLDHLSTAEFARLLNKASNSRDYDQGLTKGLGSLVKGASYQLDRVLEPAAEFSSAIGGQLFGDAGRQAFHGLPRMSAEMLPFLRATKLATVGGASLMAGNVYEKTGDVGAAAIAGGTGLLFPAAQRLGVRALGGSPAMQVEKALIARGAERGIAEGAAASAALKASNEVVAAGGRAFATQLQQAGVVGLGSRLRQMVAGQTGLFAANVASQAAQGLYTGGWHGLTESLSKEHLLVDALAQLPFGIAHLPRSLRGSPESSAVAAYANTVSKFGPKAIDVPQSLSYPDLVNYHAQQAAQAGVPTQVPGRVGTPQQPPGVTSPAAPTSTPGKEPDSYNIAGTEYKTIGRPEKIGDKEHKIGTIEWLRAKGGSQNLAFPTKQMALDWIKLEKDDLVSYSTIKVAGDGRGYVKARAKELPKTEPVKGQPAQFYQPTPQPKPVEPQIELALDPAKTVLDELKGQTGVPPVKVEGEGVPATAPEAVPPTPQTNVTQVQRLQIEKLVKQNRDSLDIASQLGIPRDTVIKVRRELGLQVKPEKAVPTALTPAQEKKASLLAEQSYTPEQIAANLSVPVELVSGAQQKESVPVEEPKTYATKTEEILDAAPEHQEALINHEDPEISLPASAAIAEITPKEIQAEIKAKDDIPLPDAVEEVLANVQSKAKRVVERRTRAQAGKAAVKKNAEDNSTWWDKMQGEFPAEVKQAFLDFARATGALSQKAEYQSDLFSAFRKWYEGTTKKAEGVPQKDGIPGLLNVLKAVKGKAERPQGDKKNRRTVSEIVDGKPVFTSRKNLSFETKSEAIIALQGMEQKEGFYYSTPEVGNRYVIREEPIIGSGMEQKVEKATDFDSMADAELFNVPGPKELPNTKLINDPVAEATPTSHAEARAKELRAEMEKSTVTDYVAKLHDSPEGISELEQLGEGNARMGAARLEFMLQRFDPAKGQQGLFDALKANKQLFSDSKEVVDFIMDAVPHLAAWAPERVKLLGLQGSEGSPEVTLQGELMHLDMLLKSVGLNDPAHYEQAVKLLNLFDNRHIGLAELQNPLEAGGLGAFSINGQGERTVWLAANSSPKLALFTLAHEMNGHGIWDLYQQGKLDPQTSQRLKQFQDFITENITQSTGSNKVILRELLDMLPGKLKFDKGIKSVVERDELNSEEVISNINALVSLAMVTGNKRQWTDFLQYMPTPISNGIVAMAKVGRKMWESLSGVLWTRDVKQKLTTPERTQLNEYIDTLKGILNIDRANQKAVENALHLQVATEPGRLGKIMLSSEGPMSLIRGTQHEATHDTAKLMSLREISEKVKNPFRKASTFWDRFLLLGTQLGQKYKELRYVTTRAVEREANYNKIEFEMLSMYNLVKKGFEWKADPNSAISKVTASPTMGKVRDNIARRVNKGGYASHMDAIRALDPEVMKELSSLSPAEQLLVRENLVKFEQVQAAFANVIRNSRYEKLVHTVAEQFMHNDSTLPREQAVTDARMQVEALQNGTFTTTGHSDIDTLMKSVGATVEDFHAHANANLGYITERRFGEYRAKVEMASGPNHYVDAHSKAEFDKIRSDYESGMHGAMKPDGWIDKTKQDPAKFHMSDAVEFLMDKDVQHSNDLAAALIREGIHPDRAREIVDQNSFGKDLRNEMALREIADSNGKIARFDKRRFVGGRQEQDTMQQQIKFIQTVARGLTKGVAQAEFNAAMASPELVNHPERNTVMEMWRNYNRVDPQSVKTMNKAVYNMFMSFHFLNMIQDAAQPLLGAVPSNMINEGGGVAKSYGMVSKAMLNMLSYHSTKKGLTPDEVALIEERRKTNSGLGVYSDETSNDILALTQARRRQEGKEVLSMGEFLKSKLAVPFMWGKNLHKHFTDFGQDAALLSLYRFYRGKGMNDYTARDMAKQTMPVAMFNAGKAGRAIGIWNAENMRPVTAAMTGLQTFSLGSIGTIKNLVDRSFLNVPGMSKGDVTNARKALATSLVSTVAQAGLYGLPFASAATLLLEKVFGIKAREAVASMFKSNDEDDSDEDVMQQIALHGVLNTITGFDVASKNSVSGVFGFNGYDGFSWEGLAGPTAQLMKTLFSTAPAELAKDGSVTQRLGKAATELLPNQLKRAVKFVQNDMEFRNQNQKLFDESTGAEKGIFTILGLKPNRIARYQEAEGMRRAASEIELAENREWVIQMAKLMEAGDSGAIQQAIFDKVQQDPSLSPEALAESITEQYIEMTTPQDPRKGRGASTTINELMGVNYKGPSEVQRQQTMESYMHDLGFRNTTSLAERRKAQKIDEISSLHPTWSINDILQRIKDSSGRVGARERRNQAWLGQQLE